MEKIRRYKRKIDAELSAFQQEMKSIKFGSKDAKKILDFCQECSDSMLAKYQSAYSEWIRQAKPIFAQMKLSDEQQLMLLKRQAALFLSLSISEEYHLTGDIKKIVKEKNTEAILRRDKYIDIINEIDEKYPNLCSSVENKRRAGR